MSQRIRTHSPETRAEALRLAAEGVPVRSIAARLCVPFEACRYWIEKSSELPPSKPKPPARGKSGVIAPPAYHRGSRWGAGW